MSRTQVRVRTAVAQALRLGQDLFCIVTRKLCALAKTFSASLVKSDIIDLLSFFTPYPMQTVCQKSPSSLKSRFSAKKRQLMPFQAPTPIQKITCQRFKSNVSEDFFETVRKRPKVAQSHLAPHRLTALRSHRTFRKRRSCASQKSSSFPGRLRTAGGKVPPRSLHPRTS